MARIFLIDENRSTRIALRAALQSKGYAVDMFDEPETALQHFSACKYDVAIIGTRTMPSKTTTGMDLVQMIYDTDENTRIILMSESNLDKRNLKRSGVVSKIDAFMMKPRGTVKLVSHIEALLKLRQQELAGLITFAVTALIALSSESGIVI
jgi:DNA-binding NtrC family response regulator